GVRRFPSGDIVQGRVALRRRAAFPFAKELLGVLPPLLQRQIAGKNQGGVFRHVAGVVKLYDVVPLDRRNAFVGANVRMSVGAGTENDSRHDELSERAWLPESDTQTVEGLVFQPIDLVLLKG